MATEQPVTLKKKLPFKRTVARKVQPDPETETPQKAEDDNGLDLFRHSEEVFATVLREKEEEALREESTLEKHHSKRRKVSVDRSPKSDSPARSSNESILRNRSITLDESDDDLIIDVKGKGKEVNRPSKSPLPRRPARERTASRTTTPSLPVAVTTIDDDDDDVIPVPNSGRRRTSSSRSVTPGRRQNKAARDRYAENNSPFGTPNLAPKTEPRNANPDSDIEEIPPLEAPEPDEFSEWIVKAQELQEKARQSAIVVCFLTSRLDGSFPVVAKRRLNQGVALLLEVWAETQRKRGIIVPEEVESSLFLTWKGNKIYRQSTLASLGVQVDAQGRLKSGGGGGEGYMKGGIHLEVWTEQVYRQWQEDRERERALKLGVLDGDKPDGAIKAEREADDEPVVVKQKKGIKVVLKAKDREPLKLSAKEDSSVVTLIGAFRTQRGIGPEWDVAIYFDGERLEEDSLVKDADVDLDDINQFEVHIKKRGR